MPEAEPSSAAPRAAILIATAALSAFAISLVFSFTPPGLRLELDPSSEPLLPAGDPARARYEQAITEFGDDQLFIVAFETDDVFAAEELRTLKRLTDTISRVDGVRSAKSLADVVDFRWDTDEQWIDIGPFIKDVPDDAAKLEALRARALANPLYLRSLVSPDARVAAINISLKPISDGELIERDIDGQIVALLEAETRGNPHRRFYVAGRPHLKTSVYHLMLNDLGRLIPASLAMLALTLAVLTRSWRMVLFPLVSALLATLWVFATIAWLGRPLTLLSVLLAPTLIAVGSVYGVHVLFRVDEECSEFEEGDTGEIDNPGVGQAMRALRVPVLISGATTAIGFAALMLTDVPAVFELGGYSILGVVFVVALTLLVLPGALAYAAGKRAVSISVAGGLDRCLDAITRGVIRAPGAALVAWAIATIVAIAAIPQIEIDTDYLSFFEEDAPVRRDFESVNRLLAGATPLFVVFDSEDSSANRFRDPEVLAAIESAQHRLDGVAGVTHTASVIDLLRRLHRVFSEDDPAFERLPDTRGGVAELMLSIPKSDLLSFTNVNQSRANLIVRTGEVGSAAVRKLTASMEEVLASEPLPSGTTATVTGNAILLARSADAIASVQPRTVTAAALAILILISLTLRSVRFGLVAMVPNVVPVLLFFGLLGAGAAPLSLPTSLIASIALGLAIDATAHYLVRYRAEREAGLEPEAAVILCNRYVGRPVATGAITLMAGFGVVGFSSFATLQHFGWLSAGTMAICLATDLILLPALLLRFRL